MDNNRKKVRALSNSFQGELKRMVGGYVISYANFEPGNRGNYTDQEADCQKLRDALIPFTYNRNELNPEGSSIGIYIFDDEADGR